MGGAGFRLFARGAEPAPHGTRAATARGRGHRAARSGLAVGCLAAVGLMVTGTAVAGMIVTAGASGRRVSGPHPPMAVALGSAAGSARRLGPLTHRADPYLFVTADRSLTRAEIERLRLVVGASEVVVTDFAEVSVGTGRTGAVGADPALLRTVAPAGTAEVTGLWQRISDGEVAIAHSIATALGAQLGGSVGVGQDRGGQERPVNLRVGALATIRLPGVGMVVDRSLSDRLGLVADSAVALVVPGAPDPVVLAATARQAVPGLRVMSLRTVLLPPSPPAADVSPSPEPSPEPSPMGPPASGPATQSPRSAAGTQGSGWAKPADGTISRGFNPVSGSGRHLGLDIAAPLGTPVRAAAAGYVLYAGPASGFGNEIILQHGDGVETVYGHMRVFTVRSGTVLTGRQIAAVGNEGRSTGPHLHFEVHVNDIPVDPLGWLRGHGVPI